MATNTGEQFTVEDGGHRLSYVPYDMIVGRFDRSAALADEMLDLLIGANGNSGYLGDLNGLLNDNAYTPAISYTPADLTEQPLSTLPTAPSFDDTSLAVYPTDTYSDPSQLPLPTVDTSQLVPGVAPSSPSPAISWSATGYTSDVYADLLARLLNDLQSGATGLDATVEQAIYGRAIARNQAANAAAYTKVNDDIAARRFSMPSGALAGALADLSGEIVRQETDINNQIIVSQGDLAQKNSQFIIQQAVAIEQLLRGTYSDSENRKLDSAKATTDMIVRKYAEDVRAYMADMEAKKNYVEAQAENLRAVIEANKGAVEIFKTQYEALETRINAVAQQNKAVVDVFTAESQGYGEQVRALTAADSNKMAMLKLSIDNARNALDAQIAEVNANIEDYKAETGIKAAVSRDMAQIAQQAIASALNSVSATAGMSYSGHEGYTQSVGNSVSLSESHSYEHDPTA